MMDNLWVILGKYDVKGNVITGILNPIPKLIGCNHSS